MGDISGFHFWVNNPDYYLLKAEKPTQASWCKEAMRLVEWGDALLSRLAQDPDPKKVDWVKAELLDRYLDWHRQMLPDHRAETNLDNHPCIHQALIEIGMKLRDMKLLVGIPELEPPRMQVLSVRGLPPQPETEEITGIIIGEESAQP